MNGTVRAGREAFDPEQGRMPIRERAGYLAGYLERLADRLHAHRDELGLIDCVDSGAAPVAEVETAPCRSHRGRSRRRTSADGR